MHTEPHRRLTGRLACQSPCAAVAAPTPSGLGGDGLGGGGLGGGGDGGGGEGGGGERMEETAAVEMAEAATVVAARAKAARVVVGGAVAATGVGPRRSTTRHRTYWRLAHSQSHYGSNIGWLKSSSQSSCLLQAC